MTQRRLIDVDITDRGDGKVPAWDDGTNTHVYVPSGTGDVATDSIWDAKGDLAVGTGGNTAQKLTVGADGSAIVAASGETTGLKYMPYPRYARKTGDQGSTSTSYADVTDLTFAVAANKAYKFRFVVFFTTSNASEGIGLSINGPSGATLRFGGFVPASASAPTGNAAIFTSGGGTDSNAMVPTAGPGATNTTSIIEGVMVVSSTPGTLALRVKAETGGAQSVTVLTNSFGEIVEI